MAVNGKGETTKNRADIYLNNRSKWDVGKYLVLYPFHLFLPSNSSRKFNMLYIRGYPKREVILREKHFRLFWLLLLSFHRLEAASVTLIGEKSRHPICKNIFLTDETKENPNRLVRLKLIFNQRIEQNNPLLIKKSPLRSVQVEKRCFKIKLFKQELLLQQKFPFKGSRVFSFVNP